MLTHIVMWKLKDAAEGAEKAENLVRLRAALEGLRGRIPELRRLEVGLSVLPGRQFDAVLVTGFDDLAALERYQKHPEHQRVAEWVGRVSEQRAAVDYEDGGKAPRP